MTTPSRPPRYRIVAALDASEYAEIVLEHALDQAMRHDVVDLHCVTVIDARRSADDAKAHLAKLVLEGLENFRASTVDWHSRLHVRIGDTADEIAELSAELDADLLVLGRFGVHAHARRGRRSTADRVLALVTCPTLVVGSGGHERDMQPQCSNCVAVRAESDGERWFCAEHASPDRLDLTTRLPLSTVVSGGGPLW